MNAWLQCVHRHMHVFLPPTTQADAEGMLRNRAESEPFPCTRVARHFPPKHQCFDLSLFSAHGGEQTYSSNKVHLCVHSYCAHPCLTHLSLNLQCVVVDVQHTHVFLVLTKLVHSDVKAWHWDFLLRYPRKPTTACCLPLPILGHSGHPGQLPSFLLCKWATTEQDAGTRNTACQFVYQSPPHWLPPPYCLSHNTLQLLCQQNKKALQRGISLHRGRSPTLIILSRFEDWCFIPTCFLL